MHVEGRARELTVAVALLCVAMLGCQGALDPAAMSQLPDGGVDLTTFEGLQVTGTLDIGSEQGEEAPLDLVQLQVSLLSQCYDELVADPVDGDSVISDVCHGSGEDLGEIDFQREDSCHANICAQQIFLCLGLKNQELAETDIPLEFETYPILIEPLLGPGIINADGSFDFRLEYVVTSGTPGNYFERDSLLYHYEIPPQASDDRTIFFRAATFAFREAGIRSVIASTKCQWELDGTDIDDAITYQPAAERSEGSEPTVADLYTVGFVESLERLADVAAEAVQHERSVAGTMPGDSGNRYENVTKRWQSPVNSEASAFALIAGSANLEGSRQVLRPVVVDGQRGPTRRAIDLLRGAAVDIDEPATDEEVVERAMRALDPTLTTASTAEVLEAADRVLTRGETSWADISLARQYLGDERQALHRIVTPRAGTGDVQRFYGMQEPHEQIGADALFALVSGTPVNLLRGRFAWDDTDLWRRRGPATAEIEVETDGPGPFSAREGVPSAHSVTFTRTSQRLEQVGIVVPAGATAATFSVYLSAPADTKDDFQAFLRVELGGPNSSVIALAQPGQWRRVSVTVALSSPTEVPTVAIVSIRAREAGTLLLWGPQLERGERPNALRPGADEETPVLSRTYMESGVAHAIDAMRQAAYDLITASGTSLCEDTSDCNEYVHLFESACREGREAASPYRYEARTEASATSTTVTLHGVQVGQPLIAVRGIDGLRCAVHGTVDGAPCSMADHLLAKTADFTFTGSATGIASISNSAQTKIPSVVGEPVFIVSGGRVVGGHQATSSSGSFSAAAVGPARANPIGYASITRRSDNAGEPIDVPCDPWMNDGFVPPLENEITEDDDSYENSWRHYLNLARRTADEADRLGEEMVDRGLELDLRAEEAREQVERLCGASVDNWGEEACDQDRWQNCEERLSTCGVSDDPGDPTYRIPFVSLGAPVCLVDNRDYGICRCSSASESGCSDESFVINCPARLASGENCQDLYDSHFNIDPYQVREVVDTFNLFGDDLSTGERSKRVDYNCEYLHELRNLAFQARSETERLMVGWGIQATQGWLTRANLARAARAIRLEQAYPNYYAITINGSPVPEANTYLSSGNGGTGYSNCPLIYPWRAPGDRVQDYIIWDGSMGYNGFDIYANAAFPCASTESCDSEAESYECAWREAFVTNGVDRSYWANHMAWAMSWLGYLGGLQEAMSDEPLRSDPFLGADNARYFTIDPGSYDHISSLPVYTLLEESDHIETYRAQSVLVDCDDPRWSTDADAEGPCAGDVAGDACDSSNWWECFSEQVYDYRPPGVWIDAMERFYSAFDFSENIVWSDDESRSLFRQLVGGASPDDMTCGQSGYTRAMAFRFDENPYSDPDCEFDEAARRAGMWNALEMACWVLAKTDGEIECDRLVELDTLSDIPQAQRALQCAANAVETNMEVQVLARMPRTLLNSFEHRGAESHYPGYGGEQLEAMLGIERGIRQIQTSVSNIASELENAAADIGIFNSSRELHYLEYDEREIELIKETALTTIRSMQDAGSGLLSGIISAVGAAAEIIVVAVYNTQLENIAEEMLGEEIRRDLLQLGENLNGRLVEINRNVESLIQAYEDVETNLSRLENNQSEVTRWLAQVDARDYDTYGRIWPVNTVMRRRESTVRLRYANALRNAKRAAFLARRAIEFRLGEDLTEMEEDLHLVEAPSTWENDICSLQGFDYQRISDYAEYPSDHYAGEYIGDYVTRLENVVESYSIDFPFSDSDDVAVVSLGELTQTKSWACQVDEGPNLFYYSDQIDRSHFRLREGGGGLRIGWLRGGCVIDEADGVTGDPCLAITADAPMTAGIDVADERLITAERVADAPPDDARPANARSSGYIYQRVDGVDGGVYQLSFWVGNPAFLSDVELGPPSDYRVRVLSKRGRYDPWQTVIDDPASPPAGQHWEQRNLVFELDDSREVEVQIHPSAGDVLPTDRGDLWIWGVQLVDMAACGCLSTASCMAEYCPDAEHCTCASAEYCAACFEPDDYYRTSDTRGGWVPCEDPTHLTFQEAFDLRCRREDGASCDPVTDAACQCARELSFTIDLAPIESGELFDVVPLATHNYNYRHGRLALSVQGSNVHRCGPDDPESCFSNGTVQYTLEHRGTDMPVRNWSGDTVLFSMPTGRVQRGRALAAEVVPTNPMTSSQRSAFEDYWREELRGRPLQGSYTLRIWDDEDLQWWNVEDVQLILEYRYWTRFGN